MLIAYSDEGVQPVTLHDQIAAEDGVVAVDYFDASSGHPHAGAVTTVQHRSGLLQHPVF